MSKSKEVAKPERQYLQMRKDAITAVISLFALLAIMTLYFVFG